MKWCRARMAMSPAVPCTSQALFSTSITVNAAKCTTSIFRAPNFQAAIDRRSFARHGGLARNPLGFYNAITGTSLVSSRGHKHCASPKPSKSSPPKLRTSPALEMKVAESSPLRILGDPPYPASTPEDAALKKEFMDEVEQDIYVFKPMIVRIAEPSLAYGPTHQAQRRRVQRLFEIQYLDERSYLMRRAAGDETARSARRSYNALKHDINVIRMFIRDLEKVRIPTGRPLFKNRYSSDPGNRVSLEEMDRWKDLLQRHQALYNAVEADTPVEERTPELVIQPVMMIPRSRTLAFILGYTNEPPRWIRAIFYGCCIMISCLIGRGAWDSYTARGTEEQQIKAKADVLGRSYAARKEEHNDSTNGRRNS